MTEPSDRLRLAAEKALNPKDFFQRFVVQFWDTAQLLNIDLSPNFPLQAR
ncbi:MAG: hypothetical protein ACRD0K_16615 [Egibacteraceae bacterium]